MRKYSEIMEKIYVTEEMRERILGNISRETSSPGCKNPRPAWLVKWLPAAACITVLLAGLAVPAIMHHDPVKEPDPVKELGPLTGSFTISEAADADELSEMAGFEIRDIPLLQEAAAESLYSFLGDGIAEIRYLSENQDVSYRKSVGTADNSGDYNEYPSVVEKNIGTEQIVLKGGPDGYSLACWNDETYSHSLSFANPVSENTLEKIIRQIKK